VPDRSPLRVAFTYIARKQWAGGYNYQLNLFSALARHCPAKIAPVLFADAHDAKELAPFSDISGVEVVVSPAFNRNIGLVDAIATGIDHKAANEFEARDIDVVFENARFYGWRLPFPVMAWFPDFQHIRLPQLFSRSARLRRDLGFRIQIASGRCILLSSESALRDYQASYPGRSNTVFVARFATEPPPHFLTADAAAILNQYRLPRKFFYLPNQFWRHKNHQAVIDALTILEKRGVNVIIVASGRGEDPREPNYFTNIMNQVRDRGIDANFCYLGMIPLAHVYALMRTSMALINPSRFEGWSSTVEEAKSFGVPMILSDIDVHREQAGTDARFFGVDDAKALASHLSNVWAESAPDVVRELLPGHEKRVAAFAADFVRVVESMVSDAGAG
jgi:glycosyltransferase involved in cell wall biosynthesis